MINGSDGKENERTPLKSASTQMRFSLIREIGILLLLTSI
jgi:hypothetical protein